MNLGSLIITIVVLGFVAWLIMQIPMPETFRRVVYGLMVLFLILWLLQGFGLSIGFPLIKTVR